MNCPVCQVPLTVAERQGVEIDYCPRCRGVWLDRGELDKIVERAAGEYRGSDRRRDDDDSDWGDDDRYKKGYAPPAPGYGPAPGYPAPPPGYRYPPHGHPHKKKKGFLSELFDFD